MEMTWEKPISASRGHHRNPSFSSTLLDQICRSIDDSPPLDDHRHRQSSFYDEHDYHRRSITAEIERSKRTTTTTDSIRFSKTSASPPPPIRPIKTSVVEQKPPANTKQRDLGGFLRKNSKALKINTDLRKAKQPISPGGKLAAFLNSLFTTTTAAAATNPKKHKKTTTTHMTEPYYSSSSSSSSSCCSTASSFSRSCFSKTPSSSSSSDIRSKRSVRFCTVNVILEDEGYNGHNKDGKRHRKIMEEENRRVMEAAKDLLRTYHMKNKDHLAMTTSRNNNNNVEEEDDDDDEDDLFELENLSAIGEELPVYGTTRVWI